MKKSGETTADRLKVIIGSENVGSFSRRSGVDETLLRNYLNGSLPNSNHLALLAAAGSCSVDWLVTGQPEREEDVLVVGDEVGLLEQYRAADDAQKAAVHALLEAMTHPGHDTWYRAGQAISRVQK